MTALHSNNDRDEEQPQDFLEKRGFTWGLLIIVLVLTLIAVFVLAYLMTTRNIPSH